MNNLFYHYTNISTVSVSELEMVLDCANLTSLVPLRLGGGKEVIRMQVDLGASFQVHNE